MELWRGVWDQQGLPAPQIRPPIPLGICKGEDMSLSHPEWHLSGLIDGRPLAPDPTQLGGADVANLQAFTLGRGGPRQF